MKNASLWSLLRKVHNNEEGAISLETILIIGAIALPILIFLIKVGWPRIRDYFNRGLDDLEAGANEGKGGGTGTGTGTVP
jgi:hypothetical protein